MRNYAALIKLDLWVGGGLVTAAFLLILSPIAIRGQSSFLTTTSTWSNLIEACSRALFINIVATAAGAWYASRPGRLLTKELINRLGGRYQPPVATELLLLGGLTFLTLNLGFLITAGFMWQSVAIGPFPWAALVIANLYVGCYLLLGYAIGLLIRTWYASLLAAALGYLLLILGLLPSGGEALVVTTVFDRIFGNSAREQPDMEQASNIMLWLGLLIPSLICLIGVIRRHSITLGILAAVFFLCSSFFARMAVDHGAEIRANGLPFYDVTPSCETSAEFSYCVHPLDAKYSVGMANALALIVNPLQNIATTPTSFYGYGLNEHSRPADAVYLPFRGNIETTAFAFALQVATGLDAPDAPTASQVAIACGLVDIARMDSCAIQPFSIREGQAFQSREQFDALQASISEARDRFVAMSPEQRQAWIETYWAALQTGTLTLEEIR
jgi:hypothetical protein